MLSFFLKLQHLVDIPRITGMVVTSHLMNKNLLKIFVKDTKVYSTESLHEVIHAIKSIAIGYRILFFDNFC